MDALKNKTQTKQPKYKMIFDIYRNQILSGDFKEGEIFHSENDLIKIHGVSRITVRHALKLLGEEGYIIRSQGNYNIVSNPKKHVWNLVDIIHDLKLSNDDLKSDIISISKISPSQKIKFALKLAEDDFVYRIERVRKIKGNSITRSISHLVPWLSKDITQMEFNEKSSITELLKSLGQISTYCDETIEAINADEVTAKLLGINPNRAIFYRERITYNQDNQPIEFVESYYNSEFAKYKITKSLV